MNKWFYVMDMHSGGGAKTPFDMYFIEAPDSDTAREIFTRETGEDPDDVACECCGSNFSFGSAEESLEKCAEYWANGYKDLAEFLNNKRKPVKVIRLTHEADLI